MDVEKTAAEWKKEGNQAFKNSNHHKAIDCYTQAIKLDPKDHSFYSNRAICLFNLGKFMECVADCDRCLEIKPDFVKAMRRKGLALIQMLKFEQALFTYKRDFELDKDNAVRR